MSEHEDERKHLAAMVERIVVMDYVYECPLCHSTPCSSAVNLHCPLCAGRGQASAGEIELLKIKMAL